MCNVLGPPGGGELRVVGLHLGAIRVAVVEELSLPSPGAGERDEVIDGCRSLTPTTPQLRPRRYIAHCFHHGAKETGMAPRVAECQAILARLELTEHKPTTSDFHRIEQRGRDRLHAVLNSHNAIGLALPRRQPQSLEPGQT